MIQWAGEDIHVSMRFNGWYSPEGSSFQAKDSFSSNISFWHRDLKFSFRLRWLICCRILHFNVVLYNFIASMGRMGNALMGMVSYLLIDR